MNDMTHHRLRDAVIVAVLQDPTKRTKDIAKDCGASESYVSQIRGEYRVSGTIPQTRIDMEARAHPDLCDWLKETKPEGITMAAHVVSILVDAMQGEVGQ